ncbi:hypothetical protein INR49_020904 [Caranx melampygus]|nr:hypothetical protein INR49_020904 [Caranx melampygus]
MERTPSASTRLGRHGLRLEETGRPEDSSPGKIYSTLKRPQVETKTETVFEYVLLDFISWREVVRPSSSCPLCPSCLRLCSPTTLRATSWPPSIPSSCLWAGHVPALQPPVQSHPGPAQTQVNSSARGGVRFVGSVLQQVSGVTNGGVHSPKRGCRSPPRSPPRTPPGDRDVEENTTAQEGSGGQCPGADWLELTAAYYRKGWSLVDSFVYWDTPKASAQVSGGLFVYEERSTSSPAMTPSWWSIDGDRSSNVKTDYGPLLHTLAEFGWLLTCFCPAHHPSRQRWELGHEAGGVSPEAGQRSNIWTTEEPAAPSAAPPPRGALPHGGGGIGGSRCLEVGVSQRPVPLEEGGFEQEEGKAEVTCM